MGEDGAWVRAKIPGVDLVVYGTAEDRIADLVSPTKWPFIPYTDRSTDRAGAGGYEGFPPLDHAVMPDYLDFQPAVEVLTRNPADCFLSQSTAGCSTDAYTR